MKKRYIQITAFIFVLLSIAGCSQSHTHSDTENTLNIVVPQYTQLPETKTITVDGKPITLEPKMARVGDLLIDEELAVPAGKFNETTFTKLSQSNKVKVIYTAPSIDTPVCSLQTKELEGYAKQKPNVDFYMISADLPFAQSRFCAANKINNLKTLSDFKNLNWGMKNGFVMKEYQLLTRSIMIVDQNNMIQYIEYTNEVTNETNLGNALAYLEQVMKV